MDSLSEETLMVNSDILLDSCANWKSAMYGSNLSSINVQSAFASFIDCGVGTSFFSSLDTAIKRVDRIANNLASSIEKTINDQILADNNNALQASDSTFGSDLNENAEANLSNVGNGEYDVDNGNKDTNIKDDSVTKETEIDSTDKNELDVLLKSLLKGNLLSSLNNLDDSTKIKEKLLAFPNISVELKEKVLSMSEEELKTELMNILASGEMISDFSKNVLSKYDSDLKNNCPNVNLSNSCDSMCVVSEILLNDDNPQATLKELTSIVANGENIDESIISFTRSFIETLADENGISSEELLNNTNYQSQIKDRLIDVNRSFNTLSTLKNIDGERMAELMSNISIGDDA